MKSKYNFFLSFFLRIIFPSILAVGLFVFFLFSILKPQFEQAILSKKKEMIREQVHSVISILQKYYNDQIEGFISPTEAQNIAISRIQYLRYGKDNKDYFWIIDTFPRMIMHPYIPELNGQNLTNYTDPTGKKLFVECVNVVNKSDSGYVQYMWQFKDDTTKILPKISYVKIFKPWQWIIGTGVYIDDVREEIASLTNQLVISSVGITSLILLLLIFISYQSYKIELKRQLAEKNLQVSHEKYRSLAEATTEALALVKNNIIIQVNDWFTKLIQTDEIIGNAIDKYLVIPAFINESIQRNTLRNPFETKLITKSKLIDVIVNISEVLIGNEIFQIYSIRDISIDLPHKRSYEKFQERLKTMLDLMKIGFIRTTLDTRGKIIDANNHAMNLLGFSDIEKLKSTYVIDFLTNTEDKKTLRKELLEQKQIIRKQVYIKDHKKNYKTILISLKVVQDEKDSMIFAEGFLEEFQQNPFDTIQSSSQFNILLHNIFSYSQYNLYDFSLPYQSISHTNTFDTVIKYFSEQTNKFLLVHDDNFQPLGYITIKEIIDALCNFDNPFQLRAFQIMKAPLMSVDTNQSLASTILKFKKHKSPLFLLNNDQESNKVIFKDYLYQKLPISFFHVYETIEHTHSIEDLKKIKEKIELNLGICLLTFENSSVIMSVLASIHDAIINRLINNFFETYGLPSSNFAFVVLGSNARLESSFSSDQDNAIIYDDDSTNNSYFMQIGKFVSENLNQIGYKYCLGNNMASNKYWNQPLTAWKNYFSEWINTGSNKNLLDINVFFDLRLVYGSEDILNKLRNHIQHEISKNRAFLNLMAQNCASYKSSLHDSVHIKDQIAILVNIARTYALSLKINETNTIERFSKLAQKNVFNKQTFQDIRDAFVFLNNLKIKHQAYQLLNNIEPDNKVALQALSEFQVLQLKYVQTVIRSIQQKIAYDFKVS